MDKNCKIVKDLLPSYIDNLLSDETNKFVEDHICSCKNCKKYFDEMNSELDKEKIKDMEMVKEVKKYKRKIFRLKAIITLIIVILLGSFISSIGYKYYIVKKSINHAFINDEFVNYKIDEYEESVEKYKDFKTMYISNGAMCKVYKGKVIEFWDTFQNHYYIDNDSKTYYIIKEELYNTDKNQFNPRLIEDFNVIPEYKKLVANQEKNPLEILKFILFTNDIYIGREGFRNEEYYIIKTDFNGVKIFIDMDTFHVERIQEGSYKSKEYRVAENAAGYLHVTGVNLEGYTKVEK